MEGSINLSYSYPCMEMLSCMEKLFLGKRNIKMPAFEEFCKDYCGKCSNAVYLSVPYEEAMESMGNIEKFEVVDIVEGK